ncbi:MAG: iron hydrogenase small subunit [Collinsella sp.]
MGSTLRTSCATPTRTPDIAKLYADWIGEPLSHTAHEWLHTDQESWKI